MSDGMMMGYSTDDQAIVESIHKKLNKGEAVAAPPAARPLPTPATPPNVPMDVDLDPKPADPALEAVEPVEGQPAEGQIAEGEPTDVAPAPTLKVRIKDEEGKDVEQEVTLDEAASSYMRHADYTRKTQALAKERAAIPQKIAESERIVTETRASFNQALQNMQQFVVQAAAPELQGINWNQLSQENPTEYVRLKQRAEQVNATLAQIRNYQEGVAKQTEAAQKRSMQEAAVTARETLNREIPGGWNDDLYTKLNKAAVNHYGFTPEEFGNIVDARIILALHDATQYRDLKSGKPIAQQKVAQAPLAVRPGASPTQSDQRRSAVDRARDTARKSGSIDDALALMQAKRRK